MRVVDSHFHWFPRSHFEKMTARTEHPRTERVGDGYRYHYDDHGGSLPLPPVWFDLDAGLALSRETTGAETTVICTTGVLAGLLDMLPMRDAIELAVSYNEEIAAAQRDHVDRFFGTATVPLHDTDEAIALAEHAVLELELVGVNLPAATANGETVDTRRLDPFYARVAELGVPLMIHPTDFAFADMLAGYDGGLHRTLGRLLDTSVTMLRLIFGGVLERHPDLKIVQSHAGGLNPYQAGRIDKNARIEGLPQPPSTYLKRVFVDTVAPQPLTIRTAVEFYGSGNVLYGTDYPCWSPTIARRIVTDSQLSAEDEARVLSHNAHALFDLGRRSSAGTDPSALLRL